MMSTAQSGDADDARQEWSPRRVSVGVELLPQVLMRPPARAPAWRQPGWNEAHAGTGSASVLVVGLSLRTGEHSSLAWQTPLAVAGADPQNSERTSPEMQLAWSLRSNNKDKAASLRNASPFRMALSGQTVVTIKPRRGRVGVTLQHQW